MRIAPQVELDADQRSRLQAIVRSLFGCRKRAATRFTARYHTAHGSGTWIPDGQSIVFSTGSPRVLYGVSS